MNRKKYSRGDTHGEDIASRNGLPWTLWKEMVSIGGSGGNRGDLGMEILRWRCKAQMISAACAVKLGRYLNLECSGRHMVFIVVFHGILVESCTSPWRDIQHFRGLEPATCIPSRVAPVHLVGQPRELILHFGGRDGPPKVRFTLSSQPHLTHRMFFMRGLMGSTVGTKLHASARVVSIAESANKSNYGAAARCQA